MNTTFNVDLGRPHRELRTPGKSGFGPHLTGLGMTNVQTLLRQAELDAEKTSAVIRLVVFLSLALAVSSVAVLRGPGFGAGTAVTLYGLGTAVGLLLAWRRIFHPAIPYLFVTFDVILVAAQVLLLAGLMGMQPRTPMAVWRAGVGGALGGEAVGI
jgi:hypothetical protein